MVLRLNTHCVLCEDANNVALKGEDPMTIIIGKRRHGLASVLQVKCNGCGKVEMINRSKTSHTLNGEYSLACGYGHLY